MQKLRPVLTVLLVAGLTAPVVAAPPDSRAAVRTEQFAKLYDKTVPYGAAWTDDYQAAKARAAAEGKLLFMLFSGSDWCSYCKRFHKDILSKKTWLDYADRRFVMLLVDFPKHYVQTAQVKEQNRKLADQYKINGLPHVIVFDGDHIVTHAHYMNNHTASMYVDYIDNLLPPR